MESPPPSMLQRQSSIETEPKTLFDVDMDSAREAALEVIQTHTKEEALRIFLEGLRPVKIAVKPEWDLQDSDVDEYSSH